MIVKRFIKAGITCIVLLGIFGVSRATAGPHDLSESSTLSRAPSESDRLRLLERSPFEPSMEVWSQIAASSDATSAIGLLARGALALDAGDVVAAQRSFESARRANAGSPYPFYYLARIRVASGDADGGIQFLREAVRRQRDFVSAYRLLGHAYLQMGAATKGFSALRTVIALAPGLMEPHLELGRAYLENGRPEHAAVELQRAAELDDSSLDAHFLLAKASLNSGMIDEGLVELERYVELADGQPGEEKRVARARLLLKRFAGGPS
jgi:tetratricopeptide (TPR) repeat protein